MPPPDRTGNLDHILSDLEQKARQAPIPIRRLVGRLLAGLTCCDALLIVADAIEEWRGEVEMEAGRVPRMSLDLAILADMLRAEAPRRARFMGEAPL